MSLSWWVQLTTVFGAVGGWIIMRTLACSASSLAWLAQFLNRNASCRAVTHVRRAAPSHLGLGPRQNVHSHAAPRRRKQQVLQLEAVLGRRVAAQIDLRRDVPGA